MALGAILMPSAWAETAAQTAPAEEGPRKRALARRATEAPVIDGVLDERVWQEAIPVSEFVQSEPSEGQPPSERTEVRVLYDDQAIYIGVVCYDSEPSKIITTDSRRDS